MHPDGATASYTFMVTPTLATRYQVKLFKNSAAARPLATSRPVTLYVAVGASPATPTNAAARSATRNSTSASWSRPAALATEIAQRWHPYFALRHAPAQQPPSPQRLVLGAGRARLSKPHRISSGEFGWTITFSFPAGQRGYAWNWTACTKTSEDSDGIGLPGPNSCGNTRIWASAPGLLPSPCTRYLACAAPAPGVKPAPPPGPDTGNHPTADPAASRRRIIAAVPGGPVVTVSSPGDQSGTVGTPASVQVTASDSAGEALTYSATLPPGLAIDPASGLISGTPATAGTYGVTVTATDTSGRTGSASFTWTITPATSVVTVSNPGDQSGTVVTPVSVPGHRHRLGG